MDCRRQDGGVRMVWRSSLSFRPSDSEWRNLKKIPPPRPAAAAPPLIEEAVLRKDFLTCNRTPPLRSHFVCPCHRLTAIKVKTWRFCGFPKGTLRKVASLMLLTRSPLGHAFALVLLANGKENPLARSPQKHCIMFLLTSDSKTAGVRYFEKTVLASLRHAQWVSIVL